MFSGRSASEKPPGKVLLELFTIAVILAVMVLALLPQLKAYGFSARQRVSVDQCGAAVLAAQTLASEIYALGAVQAETREGLTVTLRRRDICTDRQISADTDLGRDFSAAVAQLSGAGGQVQAVRVNRDGVLAALTFISTNLDTVYYSGGDYCFVAEEEL